MPLPVRVRVLLAIVAGLAACLVVVQAWETPLREGLIYDRAAIRAGDWWRLVTGHLVHAGWLHMVFNLAALLILGGLLSATPPRPAGTATVMAVLFVGTGLGLFLGLPDIQRYSGLSGVLHGLAVVTAGYRWSEFPVSAGLLGAGVAFKLTYELIAGPNPASAATMGGDILVGSHLSGALSGVLALGLVRVGRRVLVSGTDSATRH